jgi:hypothetical protein
MKNVDLSLQFDARNASQCFDLRIGNNREAKLCCFDINLHNSMQITAMWKIGVFTWVATYGQHVPDGEESTSSKYFMIIYFLFRSNRQRPS